MEIFLDKEKLVIVYAEQWIYGFSHPLVTTERLQVDIDEFDNFEGIHTSSGFQRIKSGDWIVRYEKGFLKVFKEDEFKNRFVEPETLIKLSEEGFRENQKTIFDWAEETFGKVSSNARVAARINEEMAELLKALTSDDNHPKAGEEMADMLIILFRLAGRMGYDLLSEVDKKMEINRAREWNLDGTGHGYHK